MVDITIVIRFLIFVGVGVVGIIVGKLISIYLMNFFVQCVSFVVQLVLPLFDCFLSFLLVNVAVI